MSTSICEIQIKALEILAYFDGFCRQNDLEYFVCGGCCIGSQRYRGFIPWDDDVDVFMPRPDYERLFEIWQETGELANYSLCRTNERENFHNCGALLKDNNTTFILRHSVNDDIHHGYMLDIIPIDGYAPTRFRRLMQLFYASLFSLYNAQRLPDNQGIIIKVLSFILLKMIPSKNLRFKIWKHSEKQMSRYCYHKMDAVTELVTGYRYMNIEYPKSIFSKQLYVDFEEMMIPIPYGYHEYLTKAFGDYLTPPPENKRVPKHETVFVDLKNSYKNYKGIWYCRDGKRK